MGQDEGLTSGKQAFGPGMTWARVRDHVFGTKAGRLLGRSQFARSVTVLAGGTALGQVVVVISSPFLTRLYRPADFGVLAVYVSLLSFLLGLATWRYQMAVPLAEDHQSVASLLVLCFLVLVGMTLLIALIVAVFGGTIVEWTNAPLLRPFLWMLPVSFALAGAFQVLTAWAVRNDEFGTLARTKLGQSSGQVGAQVVLGIFAIGPIGLLLGDAIGRAGGSITLARQAWQQLHPQLRSVSARSVSRIAVRYRRFPMISAGSGLLSSAGLQLPTLLIASFYGASVVGWFGLCQRLLSMSFVLVASSVGTVYLSESAKLARQNPQRLLRLFWSTVSRSCLIAIALVLIVALSAPVLFGPVFGEQWTEAGRYAQVMAVAAGFQFMNRVVGSTATVVERQELDLAAELLWILCGSGALLLAGGTGASPFMCVVAFCIGQSVGCVLSLSISWFAIRSAVRRWQEDPASHLEVEST